MNICLFWDNAIKHHCFLGKHKGSHIFIPISIDSLGEIYNTYIEEIGYDDKRQIEEIVARKGGIAESFNFAAREAHWQIEHPALYAFIRFSVLTMARFQDNDFKKSYWDSFRKFVHQIRIKDLPNGTLKTKYVQIVLRAIRKECRTRDLHFYSKNIYGENSPRVNVGVIFAHAMFNAEDITKVKRALYENGFAYDTPIKYLDPVQIQDILEHASIMRALVFFTNGDSAEKELVYDSLNRWLENWEPNEDEEISLTNTNKSRSKASTINLSWVWILENPRTNRQLKRQAGFIVRSSIGEEGIFTLGQSTWIDLSKGYAISEREYLYFIEGYYTSSNLYSPELNKYFASPPEHRANQELALRMVSSESHEPIYFYQETKNLIPFWDEKVFLATPNDIPSLSGARTPAFWLNQNEKIYFYRIREDYKHGEIAFVKSESFANIKIKGVTAGIKGKKVFLTRFPIILQLSNIYCGSLRVTNANGKISAQYEIENETDALCDTIKIPELEPGIYFLSVSKDRRNIPIDNELDEIEFEIVVSGDLDSRKYFPDVKVSDLPISSASYIPLRPAKKWIVLEKTSLVDHGEIAHRIFDFYFEKINKIWHISTNKDLYFAYVLSSVEEQALVDITYRNYSINVAYRPSSYQVYNFQVKALYDATLATQINSSFYVYSQFRHGIQVKLWCFCFELISLQDALKDQYPDIKEGAKIWIISNYSTLTKPDELIKIVSQQYFPF